ncbi:hypothetical protein DBR32_05445 [Taibaiella sp. KBW10]|uniref:hypothetical protein n=1 Tax=Taibaiella sp. KBW10 TaxID=2153357 RepID=UPI000F58F7AA|nr:hypothetical protein [Taibaiella sp. KBW10]RQO31408.1 hypothetical protein DBR32_05445 [Taibaiella sp. KBW10]
MHNKLLLWALLLMPFICSAQDKQIVGKVYKLNGVFETAGTTMLEDALEIQDYKVLLLRRKDQRSGHSLYTATQSAF